MKPCHDNNGAAIYAERAAIVHFFVLMFTLQLNILTGTLLLVSCLNTFKIYCDLCTVKAKNVNKSI